MKITTALDFPKIDIELQGLIGKLHSPSHCSDAKRLLRNLRAMVTDLSKLELQMRRSPGHNPTKVRAQLEKINFEINNLEQWITLLLLY